MIRMSCLLTILLTCWGSTAFAARATGAATAGPWRCPAVLESLPDLENHDVIHRSLRPLSEDCQMMICAEVAQIRTVSREKSLPFSRWGAERLCVYLARCPLENLCGLSAHIIYSIDHIGRFEFSRGKTVVDLALCFAAAPARLREPVLRDLGHVLPRRYDPADLANIFGLLDRVFPDDEIVEAFELLAALTRSEMTYPEFRGKITDVKDIGKGHRRALAACLSRLPLTDLGGEDPWYERRRPMLVMWATYHTVPADSWEAYADYVLERLEASGPLTGNALFEALRTTFPREFIRPRAPALPEEADGDGEADEGVASAGEVVSAVASAAVSRPRSLSAPL